MPFVPAHLQIAAKQFPAKATNKRHKLSIVAEGTNTDAVITALILRAKNKTGSLVFLTANKLEMNRHGEISENVVVEQKDRVVFVRCVQIHLRQCTFAIAIDNFPSARRAVASNRTGK